MPKGCDAAGSWLLKAATDCVFIAHSHANEVLKGLNLGCLIALSYAKQIRFTFTSLFPTQYRKQFTIKYTYFYSKPTFPVFCSPNVVLERTVCLGWKVCWSVRVWPTLSVPGCAAHTKPTRIQLIASCCTLKCGAKSRTIQGVSVNERVEGGRGAAIK